MISVAELKIALRVRNDAEDTYINDLEESAVAAIERASGEYYGEPKTVTEIMPSWSGPVWLLSTPRSITSVSVREGSDEWSALEETAYEIDGRRLLLLDDWRYPGDIRIEYEAGYDEDDEVPADVRQKVMQLVTLWFEKRLPEADTLLLQQSVIGFSPSI